MTEDEKIQWGITDDDTDEYGKVTGIKFKKVNCDLNEVEENTIIVKGD